MALEIIMPRLSDSMEEGTILQWLVAEGDRVERGQPLAEIETDKANVTYEADDAGTVLALSVGEGATVPVGAPIAVLGDPGEELPPTPSPQTLAAAGAPASPPDPATASPPDPAPASPPDPAPASPPDPATASPPAAPQRAVPRPAAPAPVAAAAPRQGRPKASPLARRLAAGLEVDLAAITGSGPHGRVIRADVERAANGGGTPAPAPAMAGPTVSPPDPGAGTAESTSAKGETTIHELNRLQRTVARRMAESRATVPDFELRAEVDMTATVELRDRLRELADPLPSYNDFIVKASALALREFPRVNSSYRDGAVETYSRINVGIAVAADDALVVPTIFDADRLSLGEIARRARELAGRVREGSISPGELSGGTFTVSNLGMFGIDSFSAVINPPQVAILAVGSLKPRPLVLAGGGIAARPTINLALACDHRALYGADGARFLDRVRTLLESPDTLLL